MPTIFPFTQGNPSQPSTWADSDSSPLILGRFRAVPGPPQRPQNKRRLSQLGLLSAPPQAPQGQAHVRAAGTGTPATGTGGPGAGRGYGAVQGDWLGIMGAEDEDEDEDDGMGRGLTWAGGDDLDGREVTRRFWRSIHDVWVDPKPVAVKRVVGVWYSRWGVLVVLPAALAISWCAIPIPQYAFDDEGDGDDDLISDTVGVPTRYKIPGHGNARVLVNFWFFLLVYYAFYAFTALIWITKVFNLYSLNWWPKTLGFPLTISLLAVLSLTIPIPVYYIPQLRWIINHNTTWISWTFVVMTLPVAIAFGVLTAHEQHLALRNTLSETQRIFTAGPAGWANPDEMNPPTRSQRRGAPSFLQFGRGNNSRPSYEDSHIDYSPQPLLNHNSNVNPFDPLTDLDSLASRSSSPTQFPPSSRHRHSISIDPLTGSTRRQQRSSICDLRRWHLPASFVRFIWFCLALFIGLMVYVMGEAYAEMYLRTLPHNTLQTVVYVYSWVVTVHILDAITGWILGGNEGERVGSYPLGWVFKLYFMLTYQTYVRALYARLRSPSQFILLQSLSSSFLILLTPTLMSQPFHSILHSIGINNQPYPAYQKMQARNVFIRALAENASMLTFLASICILHFGANKDLYPYFAFEYEDEPYDFNLTFYASCVTWGCEIGAQVVVRGLLRMIFGVNVGVEGKMDLGVWPELLPTSVVVMLHVLQNMLFSIIRLQFR